MNLHLLSYDQALTELEASELPQMGRGKSIKF